jgi:uncharacterized protein (DUF697 family)
MASLAVGGASELAPVLRRMFLRGGADPKALGFGEPEGATVYVHVLGAADDEAALRRANRARVPAVAIATEPVDGVPYVLATDVIRVEAGRAFPLAEIARVIANRLGEDGAPLAAHVPVLREAVCERLVALAARRNGLAAIRDVGSAVLTANQLRLVQQIAQAYGEEIGLSEGLATFGAGVGFRAVAREALAMIPVAGWAVRGAVAYAGTRALGETAKKRFELAASAPAPRRFTPLRAAAVPVAP